MPAATEEYSGLGGMNYFTADRRLQAVLRLRVGEGAFERLSAFGELCGGRLAALIEAAHRDENLPRLAAYDRWGKRIDELRYCPEQLEARRLVLEAGPLPPTPLAERMAMAYLANQNGEGGVTCPLAMTDGLVDLLRGYGTVSQRDRYLHLLSDPSVPTPLTGGQFVTERQGGSNVSENETRARLGPDGRWRLSGLKWFCSNPGELWVTTAKPEGSEAVALFLMPRRRPDGSLNSARILRIKDLCGTRGKATAEVEYDEAHAELIGRPSHGLAILMRTVIRTSRIHVAAGSLGMARRALCEARLYASQRLALGRPIARLPGVASALERMEARVAAGTVAFFEALELNRREEPLSGLLVPLLKVGASRAATECVREAQMVFAGNGILRDFSILPRLSQDALIQEIWEGTHAVLASHAEKAFRRSVVRRAWDRLLDEGERAGGLRGDLSAPLEALRELRSRLHAAQGEELCSLAYHALSLCALLREAGGPLDVHGDLAALAARLAPLAPTPVLR